MLKKVVRAVVVLSMVTGLAAVKNADASRARLLVHGTGDAGLYLDSSGNGGSLTHNSPYNIFYNPSYVNDYKNWAIIEKSNSPGTSAQGGFVASLANFSFGLYLNRVAAMPIDHGSPTDPTKVADRSFTNAENFRPIDLLLGMDMGMLKWGVSFTYGSYKTATIAEQRTGNTSARAVSNQELYFRGGIQMKDIEPFVGITIFSKDDASTETKTNYTTNNWWDERTVTRGEDVHRKRSNAGVRYHWGEWTPYLAYASQEFTGTRHQTLFGLGFGRETQISEAVMAVATLSYWRDFEAGHTVVPIGISAEGKLASWFAVRGGVVYRLTDQTNNNSATDNTTGRVGASFLLDNFAFDWAIGNSKAAATATAEGSSDLGAQTFDVSNGFFTAASVAYKW